jgi:DNA polymerase-3 subunit delta'
LQIEAGTHPDFFSVRRPEDLHEFPTELMKELCERFAMKSARGRGKVVLLEDADDLNEESANRFLKTLEEPPPRSVLILIGSSADRQLPTIVSRCQVIRFAPLPPSLVEELLLFDLEADPDELVNRAEDPAYQKIRLDHANKMLSWRMTHADRTLASRFITERGVIERAGPRRARA